MSLISKMVREAGRIRTPTTWKCKIAIDPSIQKLFLALPQIVSCLISAIIGFISIAIMCHGKIRKTSIRHCPQLDARKDSSGMIGRCDILEITRIDR